MFIREEVKDIKGERRVLKVCKAHPNFRESMDIRPLVKLVRLVRVVDRWTSA